jgi:hypothetical protein
LIDTQACQASTARTAQLQDRIAALQQQLAEGRAAAAAQRLQLAAVRSDTLEATAELVRAAPTLAAAAFAAGQQQQQQQPEGEEELQQQVDKIKVGCGLCCVVLGRGGLLFVRAIAWLGQAWSVEGSLCMGNTIEATTKLGNGAVANMTRSSKP